MFDLDFGKIVLWLLPNRLRTTFNVAWLNALVSPIVTVYNNFVTYRTDIEYKLNHNGQVCYLEAVLNDAFDLAERRIYISDSGGNGVILLQRDSDLKPVLLNPDDTGAVIIQPSSGYDGGEYDFIVNIPYRYSDADMYRLKALVNYYKLAGKRFDVVVR